MDISVDNVTSVDNGNATSNCKYDVIDLCVGAWRSTTEGTLLMGSAKFTPIHVGQMRPLSWELS